MPQCTHCGHEFAISENFRCPACGKDWRGSAQEASAAVPAHLAVLDAGGAPESREPKKRLVSTAGPAVPVLHKQDDSVPSGWMARLEAARAVAKGDSGPPAPAASSPPAQAPSTPPPLKPALQKRSSEVGKKPAHLLVAQLEADEQRRRDAEQARLTELFDDKEPDELISKVEVDLPDAPAKKKRIPDWLVMAVLGLLVLGGIGLAYDAVRKEPTPVVKIDPELEKKAALRKKAMAALEEGHGLALKGPKHADAAIEAYKRALSFEPTLASAERGIAIAYAAKDDDAAAVQHYRRYIELSPEAHDANEVKAIIARWEKSKRRKGR